MLEKIFEEGLLDYQKLLLRFYLKLELTHEEYIILLHLFRLRKRNAITYQPSV